VSPLLGRSPPECHPLGGRARCLAKAGKDKRRKSAGARNAGGRHEHLDGLPGDTRPGSARLPVTLDPTPPAYRCHATRLRPLTGDTRPGSAHPARHRASQEARRRQRAAALRPGAASAWPTTPRPSTRPEPHSNSAVLGRAIAATAWPTPEPPPKPQERFVSSTPSATTRLIPQNIQVQGQQDRTAMARDGQVGEHRAAPSLGTRRRAKRLLDSRRLFAQASPKPAHATPTRRLTLRRQLTRGPRSTRSAAERHGPGRNLQHGRTRPRSPLRRHAAHPRQ